MSLDTYSYSCMTLWQCPTNFFPTRQKILYETLGVGGLGSATPPPPNVHVDTLKHLAKHYVDNAHRAP